MPKPVAAAAWNPTSEQLDCPRCLAQHAMRESDKRERAADAANVTGFALTKAYAERCGVMLATLERIARRGGAYCAACAAELQEARS